MQVLELAKDCIVFFIFWITTDEPTKEQEREKEEKRAIHILNTLEEARKIYQPYW